MGGIYGGPRGLGARFAKAGIARDVRRGDRLRANGIRGDLGPSTLSEAVGLFLVCIATHGTTNLVIGVGPSYPSRPHRG